MTSISRYLLLFLGFLVLAGEAQSPASGSLPIGPDLTYKRGTARAKEQLLEFPYTHRNSDMTFWAWVVHEGDGSRLIAKEDEAVEGKKDESGNLINHDFPREHPFQKTLDQIKLDALFSLYDDLKTETSLDKEGWHVLGDGSAVNKIFFKDSKRQPHALLAVQEDGRDKLTGPPMLVKFERTRQGIMMYARTGAGSWQGPQPVNPQTNMAGHRVFRFLEGREGF
jgi:hypothetical protein